ncbi:MAG: 4Fe-4S binding protein [Bacteroidia bacterium]|nr:4Fe-4S binding protein [Bacteroidia bacterium]
MQYQHIRKPIVIASAILFHLLLIFHLLFSPVIIIFASNNGIINASFIVFLLLFVLSIFFGRAYCAWFCPGCGVQEIMSIFIKRKARNTKALYIKYIIFILWIGAIISGYIIKGISKVDFFYGMSNITFERKIILTLGAIAIIVPITAIFGRFASCKYICWQAPFMIIGTKIRDYIHLSGLRLQADADKCKNCNECSIKCPMNIDVMRNVKSVKMNDKECILCGNCVDSCKHKVIKYVITKK